MASSASSGPAAPPLAPSAGAPALDHLLADLRRRSWEDPVDAGRALLQAAAGALAADVVTAWLFDDAGTATAIVRHPPRPGGCPVPDPASAGEPPPDYGALSAEDAPSVERALGHDLLVDAGIWVRGTLAGALRVRRARGTGWSPAERAFVVGLADRLSHEVLVGTRQAAEQALAERERQMEQIERIAGMGSWSIDLAHDRVTWSREQLRMNGLDPDRAPRTQAEVLALVHPDDRQPLVERFTAFLESGAPLDVEYRVVRPDGAVRLLQVRGQLVPGPDGAPTRVVGTALDVTERRATELALRASEVS